MFDWIDWLWNTSVHAWIIGSAVLLCLGVMAAGVIYEVVGPAESDRAAMCWAVIGVSALVAAIWPLVLIAAPFLLVVGGMFFGGIHIAQGLKRT